MTSGFKLLVRLVDHVVAMQFDADQARQHVLGTHRRRRRQERLRDELSVAASWAVAFDRLALDDPLALDLLTVAAWCGPEPIPLGLLTDHPDALPRQLQPIATDPLVLARCTPGAYAGAAMITRSRTGSSWGSACRDARTLRANATSGTYSVDEPNSILTWCQAEASLEMTMQVTLVGEPGSGGDVGNRVAAFEQPSGLADAVRDLQCVGR